MKQRKSTSKKVHVKGHSRKEGVKVKPYDRKK